ncbi:MAG: hypothetical protein JWR51_4498 [Devosia sp.]|nr:hypothetical protein [Devosia sp.]
MDRAVPFERSSHGLLSSNRSTGSICPLLRDGSRTAACGETCLMGFVDKRDSVSPHAMGFLAARTWPPLGCERRAGPGIARPHSPPTKLPTAVRREPAAIVGISGEIMGEVLRMGRRGIKAAHYRCHPGEADLRRRLPPTGLPAGLTRGSLWSATEGGGVARGPRVKPAGRGEWGEIGAKPPHLTSPSRGGIRSASLVRSSHKHDTAPPPGRGRLGGGGRSHDGGACRQKDGLPGQAR